jgi:regulator of replication initiation timing
MTASLSSRTAGVDTAMQTDSPFDLKEIDEKLQKLDQKQAAIDKYKEHLRQTEDENKRLKEENEALADEVREEIRQELNS